MPDNEHVPLAVATEPDRSAPWQAEGPPRRSRSLTGTPQARSRPPRTVRTTLPHEGMGVWVRALSTPRARV